MPAVTEIGLSLGSNLGDRLANLTEARRRIAAIPGVSERCCSPVYETQPVGVAPAQRRLLFLNAVVIVASPLPMSMLSDRFHAIEAEMGRVRGPDRNSPRPIDIDILYAGGIATASPGLTVPHPRWRERQFVVRPLCDVRPDLRLPGESLTVREVWESLPGRDDVRIVARAW